MNQYTVDFRIEGESLLPEQVTLDLALEPSLVRRKGDRRGTSEFEFNVQATRAFARKNVAPGAYRSRS